MIELLSPQGMGEVDRASAAAGVSGATLMDNAGRAVAASAQRRWPDARRVLVLAGPGNNGGDGFVAARILAERGIEIVVAALGDRSALRGDAAAAASAWTGETRDLAQADYAWPDLIVDALFGAGLSRPLDGAAAEAVGRVNASGRPVLAVDVPSGLDGATGEALGGLAVQAAATATFVRLKPGHVLLPGRSICGPVDLADIGTPAAALAAAKPAAWLNRPELWADAVPTPAIDAHKYTRGHVAVWSGPALRTGAARLAAVAAFRAGAGAVTIVGERDALQVHAAHVTAIMLREPGEDGGWADILKERRVAAVAIGPGAGVGDGARLALAQARAAGCATVIDADVFSMFPGDPEGLAKLIATGQGGAALTPHDGEFARLFGSAAPAGSRLERATAAAARLGAVIVLKGPDTVVAAPDGRAAIADNAPPDLATAGAGDVLAGICAGLMAQRAPAFEAAAAAVWLHGEAAKVVGRGLIADDLPAALPAVLQRL
ncbi:NAD(P)H-hydrate dehydratase [Hansschlegelia beijingensis]|uniref:Bifunctional NAD(P)H-hydrate repair enzyme n=1 Tax=Hansschlegelia beijingensis TaxID=1133344 RepID=A0A7W6GI25_9HYPH|nr:NAD(P)H-hydrate dehydratase [Hansschlegelia beijingensis]MBB3974419.1 hydroxyethylthiazole kinase-like uncharacterized protein yjeF [Hansschlegelia beijingensis]